jgi:putative membrane protein
MFGIPRNRLAVIALSASLLSPAGLALAADRDNPGAAAANQGTSSAEAGDKSAERSSDHHFVKKAAEGNLSEVKLGELAQQQASAQDVKDFGKRMVDDHSKALSELKQLAQTKNITVESDLKGEEKEHYDKLAKLQGKDFDRAYIQHMVKDHDQDIAEFRNEAQNGKDADVKAWAAKTLPTLEEHARLIEKVAQSNGVQVEGARTAGERQTPDQRQAPSQGNTGADTQGGAKPQK